MKKYWISYEKPYTIDTATQQRRNVVATGDFPEAIIGNPVKDRSSHLYCNVDKGTETIDMISYREGVSEVEAKPGDLPYI